MINVLTKNLRGTATTIILGLAFLLISLMPILTGCQSGSVSAQEIAANSLVVQDALGGQVKVVGAEIGDGKALVICTDTEGNSYVVAEIDLDNKTVTEVSYPAVGEPYLPNPQMESEILKTVTNQLSYAKGEEVIIEITNISAETISGGGVYFSVYDLDGNLLAGNGLFLAFEWAAGDGLSAFTWNQANDKGEQVGSGTYVIVGKAGDYSDAILISIN